MVKHARREVFIASAGADDGVAELLASLLGAAGLPATGFWNAPRGRGREAFVSDAMEAPAPVLVLWSAASLNSPRVLAAAALGARDNRLFEAIVIRDSADSAGTHAESLRLRIPAFPDRMGRFDGPRTIFRLLYAPGGSRDADETTQLQAALELFLAVPQIRPVAIAAPPGGGVRPRQSVLWAGAAGFAIIAGMLALQGGPLGAAAADRLYAAIDLHGAIRGLQGVSNDNAVDPDLAPPETRSWDPDLAGLPPEIARAVSLARAARDKAREAARMAEAIAANAERIARAADTAEIRKKDTVFRGEIRAGSPDGIGRREFPDGARFWGKELKSGREGPGVFLFANRETFHGEFRGDFPNGYGRYGFAGGSRFEGRFAGGSIAGYGVMQFADGQRYEGAFGDDSGSPIFQGPGILWPVNGRPVHGIWQQGELAQKPSTPRPASTVPANPPASQKKQQDPP